MANRYHHLRHPLWRVAKARSRRPLKVDFEAEKQFVVQVHVSSPLQSSFLREERSVICITRADFAVA